MKFYDDMPQVATTGDKVLMVGDPNAPNTPKRISIEDLKTFINFENATVQYITNLIANYYLKTETYSKGEVNNLIANIQGLQFKIIANISEVVDSRYIYLLPISKETGNNKYSEYLYINRKAELMGEFNTSIDLSNYITSGQLTAALSAYVTSVDFNAAINNLANTYVAKEEGKSLIEDAKIEKLDALLSSSSSDCVNFEKVSDVEYDINI